MTNTETGWTKFSDKLPEEGRLIIAQRLEDGRITASFYDDDWPQTGEVWCYAYTEAEVQARELAARGEAFEAGWDAAYIRVENPIYPDFDTELEAYLKTLEK